MASRCCAAQQPLTRARNDNALFASSRCLHAVANRKEAARGRERLACVDHIKLLVSDVTSPDPGFQRTDRVQRVGVISIVTELLFTLDASAPSNTAFILDSLHTLLTHQRRPAGKDRHEPAHGLAIGLAAHAQSRAGAARSSTSISWG